MALVALIFLMLAVRLVLFICSRGAHERMLYSSPAMKDLLLAAAERAASGSSGDDPAIESNVAAERLDPTMRARISLAFGARVLIIALLCLALVAFASVSPVLAAIFPALSTCLLPALDSAFLVAQGRIVLPRKTVPERIVLVVSGAISFVIAWVAFVACLGNYDVTVGGVLLSYVLLLVAYLTRRLGMRVARAFSQPQFERYATGETVLYLRSFSDDGLSLYTPVTDSDLRSLLWPRISFEEFVGYCAGAACGNLITIGRPGERLPRAGAWRSYFDDDAWQEAVRLTMLRCGAILLTTGDTTSLAWEIQHIKQWGMLQKCVFLVPPLPEEQAERRIDLALESLGVGADKRVPIPPASTIAGFRVLADGSVHWLLCAGRDWGAYFFAVVRGTSAVGRKLRADSHAAGDVRFDEVPGAKVRGGSIVREKPLAPPGPVSQAARRTLRAGSLYEAREDYAQAAEIYASCLEELSGQPGASSEALMYLRVMRLRCALRVGTKSAGEFVREIEELVRDSEGMPLVWISPTFEAVYGDEFRAWMYFLMASILNDMGKTSEERAALEKCFGEAVSAGVAWRATDAQLELAAISRDPSVMRDHAQRALDLAEGASDALRAVCAKEWLAHAGALDDPLDPRWAEMLLDVVNAMIDLGESRLALNASMRGVVDARRLGDEAARQEFLAAQERCKGM